MYDIKPKMHPYSILFFVPNVRRNNLSQITFNYREKTATVSKTVDLVFKEQPLKK